MTQLEKIIRYYLLVLPFAPFIAYYMKFLDSRTFFYYNYGLGCIGLTILLLFTNNKGFRIPKYIFPLFLLFIYYYISDTFSGKLEALGFISYFYRNITLSTILILLLIENVGFDYDFFRKMNLLIKLTIVVGVCFTLYQILVDQYFFMPQDIIDNFQYYGTNKWESRHSSIFAYLGPNELGLSFIAVFSLFIGTQNYLNKKNWQFYILVVSGSIIAVASNARYVLISLIIILLQFVITRKTFFTKFKVIILSLLIGISLLILLSIFGYDINLFISDRVLNDASTSARILSFDVFLELFPRHILFGSGKEITSEVTAAMGDVAPFIHVGYLSHLYAYGIVGSFLLFSFWWLLIKRIYRNAKTEHFWGSFLAFLAFFFTNTTLVYMNILTYGLIIAIIYNEHYRREYSLGKEDYYQFQNEKNDKFEW